MKMLLFCSRRLWALLRAAFWCICVISGAPALLISQPSGRPSDAERKTLERNFDLLPLRFEPNQGQSSSDAKFIARGRGFSAQFKENEAAFLFPGHSEEGGPLRVTLLNASRNATVSGEKRFPGVVNYFTGNDRDKWQTGLPTFESLRYTGVYPGTDLIYYGNKGRLEFDFQLSPGAAPSHIQMRFEGARNLTIDGKGDLIVTAKAGNIAFQKPVIYQPAEGGRKDIVAGCFKILENDTVGFNVASYDRTRPLIIDPILNYSTYIGGYAAQATSIAVDKNGDAYITGMTSQEFPTTPGSYQPVAAKSCAGNFWPDCGSTFVAKFNSTGTALLYSTFLSGSGMDSANGIALDAKGDVFVVGTTSSTDFPVTDGALQTTYNLKGIYGLFQTTGFVTELNSTGTSLLYSTYLGGSTWTSVNQVAIDASGNAYLTGNTQDKDFPTTPGAFRTTVPAKTGTGLNLTTAFIAKLNPAGSALVYSTYLGGNWQDNASAIAADSAGEAYVGGWTSSSDFPVTQGAYQTAKEASNQQAGFIAKLNASGSALVYSTFLSGKSYDSVSAIALDSNGDAYATGKTNSPDFPITAGAFQSNIGISNFGYPQVNAFVSELNSAGTALVYSSFLGGNTGLYLADEGDEAKAIAVDAQGMVYLTGLACTVDFPVTAGAFGATNLDMWNDGECTAFLTKMNPAPDKPLLYSTFFGGTGNSAADDYYYGEEASGLAIDPSGNVYLAGFTYSVDFPTTAGVIETSFSGPAKKAFIAEFIGSEMKSLPVPVVTLTSNTRSVLFGQPVTFTATVHSASGNNTPTGYVGFNFFHKEAADNEGGQLGFGPWTTVAINGAGEATFTTSSLEALQTQVNAFYLGDANNAPGTGAMTQTLTFIPTTTTVTSSVNNVPFGTNITFTITVVDQNGNPLQGTVSSGYGNLGSWVFLNSNGQGTWTDSSLPVGNNLIYAKFLLPPDGYAESSGTVNVTITPVGTTPTPVFAPPAGTYTAGQQVTLSDPNPNAIVYYTTDGTAPVPGVSPQAFTGIAIPVNVSEKINALAVAPGYSPSDVVSAVYTINLPAPGFTTGPGATTSISVIKGSTSGNSGTVSVVGTSGFSGTVNLTCSVTTAMTAVNSLPTCSLSPVSVSLSGTVAQTSTLTVTTTAASSAVNRTGIFFWASPGGTALAFALFFGVFRRRAKWAILGLFVFFVFAGMTACGGGSGAGGGGGSPNSGTSIGNYTITVTGTSGSISSTVGTVALTVQ